MFASEGTTGASPFTVPDPDPNELFPHFSFQIFGTQTPTENQPPTMLGFLVDYLIATGNDLNTAERIMESYSPGQVPVLGQLARNYAVCDRWFGSVSAQTWPNRGFMHTGTSRGQVTNSSPFAYNTETIFDVLQKTGKSWRIYKDTLTRKPSSRGKANKIRYFGERGGAPAFVQAFLPLGDRRATRWDKSREASFFIPDE